MRFVHLADTHIRNLKYHKEYRVVFDRLYKKLKKQKPDFIIHCGDIAHTKTQISPEFVQMCSDFLKNLADIAPTYVILGNHDGNLKNSYRQDALTPIVNALCHPSLYLLRDSGEVALNSQYSLNVLSVFDKDNWQEPTDKDKINIALYHGSISNCQTDAGWVMERGENGINIFDNFDYAFLGDIHKTNQSLDKEGKIRYPGSTIQQNFGETNDKGYLLWDIESKEEYKCEHFSIENPKPFITLQLTPKGRLPSKNKPAPGARLRLVSDNNLPLDVVRKAVDIAKVRFKPESITYLNRGSANDCSINDLADGYIKEDLRDVAVQESLIEEYLKDYQISDEVLNNVFQLNIKYNSLAEEQEEVSRNINWKLRKLEWDNLFNYGEGNSVNFENLNGIVGILGKNFSGKSSVIDSLLYALYNTTSKNNRKNINIINQNKQDCRAYVEIDVGTKTYKIERTSYKYTKKLKGKITTEAKTDVEFVCYDNATGFEKSLNGLSRLGTDKNIRKIFGTVDDFLTTSMASQLGSLSYISEGSTKRKEILAKFLDLEMFDYKFKKAKEDFAQTKALLRHSQEREFDAEIKIAREEYAKNDTNKLVKERECSDLDKVITNLAKEQQTIETKIKALPAEIINIQEVNSFCEQQKDNLSGYEKQNEVFFTQKQQNEAMYQKLTGFLETFDVASLEEKQKIIQANIDQLDQVQKEISSKQEELRRYQNKSLLLKEVPCGNEYSHCKFIKDAHTAVSNINTAEISLKDLSLSKDSLKSNLDQSEHDKITDYLDKYAQVIEKKAEVKNSLSDLELKIEKNKLKIMETKSSISKLEDKKEEYEKNRDTIENLEALNQKKKEIKAELKSKRGCHQACQSQVLELYKTNGWLEQKLNKIEEEKQNHLDMQEQYSAYDLFMRCMHANGISYDIIKKRLPIINDEVAKILTNIVDFEVYFVNEENKLDILIKHPKHDPRPIEMGSGAEKTIAAIAIRLALLNVSTLPKGDVFILDEPGTALDEENMEGFTRILDMIKSHFKTVVLISHVDSLKDTVDTQILIDKKESFAHVNY